MLEQNRGGFVCLLLTVITGGLYGYYLTYKFAEETNLACQGDGQSTSGLAKFIIFSILTLGIYALVWNYSWINRCSNFLANNGQQSPISGTSYLLSVFFGGFTLGIWNLINYFKMISMQNMVNAVYNASVAR